MNQYLKAFTLYASTALFALLFTNIYAVFGHGVRSPYMDYMFAVPLAASLPFLCMFLFRSRIYEKNGYRLFHNAFGSGAAALTVGLLLRGILQIAGGSSAYAPWFIYIGAAGAAFGVLTLLFLAIKGNGSL